MNVENKYLKFNVGDSHTVEFTLDQLFDERDNETNPSWGKIITYDIKHKYGFNKLTTSPGLHSKLKDLEVKKGDKVEIKKITFQTKEGEPRTTFEVGKIFQVDDISEVIDEVKTSMTLEEKVNVLWSEHEKKQSKSAADDLPF